MTITRHLIAVTVMLGCIACGRGEPLKSSEHVTCPFTPADARLDSDRVAGLPMRATIGELRAMCPAARHDSVDYELVGMESPALTFKGMGVVISAILRGHDEHPESLVSAERPGLWIARGDSLRFPDGALIPKRAGEWRRLDSIGVVVVDHGDDSRGSIVLRCRYPWVHGEADNVWPSFAKEGAVPLSRVSPADTQMFWQIEVAHSDSAAVTRLCKSTKR